MCEHGYKVPILRRLTIINPITCRRLKPANILLSGIQTGYVTAKVEDSGLGEYPQDQPALIPLLQLLIDRPLVVPSGSLLNAQPYAMRAPEVFLGHACAEPSQVWAVAAVLLCWGKSGSTGRVG